MCICTRSCICFDEGRKLNVLVYFSHKRFIFKIKYSKVYLCFIHLDEAWIHLLPVWYTTDVPQLIWVLSKRASFDLLSGLYCPGSISNKYQFLRYFQYEYAMPPNFSSILPGWYILYILETCSLSQSVRKCQDLQKTLEVSFYDLQREKLMSHPKKTFMDFLLL